jgi:vacuolar-type H+-ATPase subunit E/Vma4
VGRRAHQKAVQIAEDARRRSAAILEGAKEESETIRREAAEDAERQAAASTRRFAARAELEAKRRFIELREEPIERVWGAAEERLRDVEKTPAYPDMLKCLAVRASKELKANELVLAGDGLAQGLLSDEVLDRWSKEEGIRFHRAAAPLAAWGGLIATSGRTRIDLTFATRLASARARLRERVFEVLNQEPS